jgi:uncharacterized protein (DUF169 family)
MSSYTEISRCLIQALHLTQAPVAVSLTETIPSGVQTWEGHSPAGCRFWQEAEKRVFATSAADHQLCAIGLYTHNLEMTPPAASELATALKVFADLTYVRAEDVPMIPVLNSKPKHVIYGPLADMPVAPDVVLLFVHPGQALIAAEASQQLEGGIPPAMGRPACAIIPQAKNSGRSALSLGCCGARAYLDILPDEVALYAVPGTGVAAFAERVSALANANEMLSGFHRIRRKDVDAGRFPTIQESLMALENAP